MSEAEEHTTEWRCEVCDVLNSAENARCIGCGTPIAKPTPPAETPSPLQPELAAPVAELQPAVEQTAALPSQETKPQRPTRNTPSFANPLLKLFTVAIVIGALWLAYTVQQNPEPLYAGYVPTATPVTPTATNTPFPTRTPTPTLPATLTPTNTPTPFPTPTAQPPLAHTITDGEFLVNIALFYRVSMDSIIAENPGLSADSIRSGQQILVPYPTATPPLEPVEIIVNGQSAIADPTDCIMHEIAEGDSYFTIANQYNVTLDAILEMNRLTEFADLVRPGDAVCIPTLVFNAAALGPTSGVRSERAIEQPRLLYPPTGSTLAADRTLTLQWIAERDLTQNEWYMVELTNLDDVGGRPIRTFTRQTSYQVGDGLLAADADASIRWRVSFVDLFEVDGTYRYSPNGPASEAAFILSTP